MTILLNINLTNVDFEDAVAALKAAWIVANPTHKDDNVTELLHSLREYEEFEYQE